jgi:predicted ATPase
MQHFNHLFIISGGPGSGKSTLIQALASRGFHCMPEAGRAIIQDQLAIGGSALPWANKTAFAELMLNWDLRSYREAQLLQGPVLFDRGIPDVMGYLLLCGLPVPPHIEKAAQTFRYNQRVFLAPHWPEIFTQDAERKQSEAEASATYHRMVDVYTRLGYHICQLPLTIVEERVQFVLENS